MVPCLAKGYGKNVVEEWWQNQMQYSR